MSPLSWKLCVGLLSLLVLSACGTTPVSSHYRLSALAPLPSVADGLSLGVGPVSIPEYLNRDGLVRSDGANALSIAGSERWAEPLEDGVTRVTILNLAGLLETQDIRRFPWHPERAPQIGIKLNILTLDTEQAKATLVAEWLVYQTDGEQPVTRRLTRYEEPLAGAQAAGNDIAAAYSKLLLSLSQDIAAAVRVQSAPAAT
ncbi:MAG: PqiC family protein [Halioglobus sp.]